MHEDIAIKWKPLNINTIECKFRCLYIHEHVSTSRHVFKIMVTTKIFFRLFLFINQLKKKRIFDLKYVYLALDAQFNNACSYTTLKFVIQNSERQKGLIYPVFQNILIILQQIIKRS